MSNVDKDVKNAQRFSFNRHENQALLFESPWIFSRSSPKKFGNYGDSFLKQDPEFYWHKSYFELTKYLKSMPHPDKVARMIVDQLLLHSVKILPYFFIFFNIKYLIIFIKLITDFVQNYQGFCILV